MSLFWYPEINTKYKFDEAPDKDVMMSSYVKYFLARLQSMFKYNNLPDSIPAKWLENMLLTTGMCVWIKNGEDLIVTTAGVGGQPDVYYIPTECIVANPYVKEGVNRTYTRDEDCILMTNDTYAQGILPLVKKYASMLVENDITMNIACIFARAIILLSAADDETKESAELWLKKIIKGQFGIIGEAPFLLSNQDKSLNITPINNVAATLTDLIEYEQYLKASLYNELGLNSNYNMKREAINSNESQLNDDMLHPLIDDMLRQRQEALEKVNSMFGTDISVEFNSAWKINEEENDLMIEGLEAEVEQTEAEVDQVETEEAVNSDDVQEEEQEEKEGEKDVTETE